DEGILLHRIAKRVADMQARGESVRADDNAEALEKRVHAYRLQTSPLVSYYSEHGLLRTTDGMAPIDKVSAAIDRILGKGKTAAARAAAPARRKAMAKKPARRAGGARKPKAAKGAKVKRASRKGATRTAGRRAAAKRRPARKNRRKAINKAGRRG